MANEFITRQGLKSLGGVTFPYTKQSSGYTMTENDYFVDCEGTFTLILPDATNTAGKLYVIKNSSGGTITIDTYLNQTIDGKTSIELGESNSIQIASDGENFVIISYDTSNLSSSTGVFEFDGLSLASTDLFNVGALKGWIVDDSSDPLSPEIYYVNFTGGTFGAAYRTTDTATWVYMTSGGTVSQQPTPLTEQQRRQNIFLGMLGHANKSTLINAFNQPDFVLNPLSQLRDMFAPINLINGGVKPSPNGTNLSFNTSAGYLYGLGINFTVDPLNPDSKYITGTNPCTFQYRTQTGGTSSNTIFINPTLYDVGGLATPISGTKATNQRIYLVQNGVFRVQYGQTVYTTLAQAVAGISTEQYVEFTNFETNGILIGVLSVLSSCTDLSDQSKALFFNVSKFGDSTGAAGGTSTTNLQQAYNNSSEPEIITNSILGALTLQRGSASDSNSVFEVRDGSGITKMLVNGSGRTTTTNLSITGITSGSSLTRFVVVDTSGNTFYQTSGADGTSGTSGTNGSSGTNGTNGTSGVNGTSGLSGTSGTDGTSGVNGTSGLSGTSGSDGTSGTNGTSGTSGVNGTSGLSGTSGTDGTSGTSGVNGTSGLSGTSGTDGTSGFNGTSGTDGTSGVNGTSGTNGTDGTSGFNGTSGTDGTSGVNGTSGTNGTSGVNGNSGTSGTDGTSGTSTGDSISGTTNYIPKFTSGNTIGNSIMFESNNSIGVGTTTPGSRLDVRAQGALSTDIAFRVRNSVNTFDIIRANGVGDVFIGLAAGNVNTGDNNTFVGRNSGLVNTTGGGNTANGRNALFSNTTGNNNTANGYNTLRSNTTGGNNTANGINTLRSNTTGGNNTANGANTLHSNTTGANNTANGVDALFYNTTGNSNTANGTNALLNNTTGGNNTANGFSAGRYIADGTTPNTTPNNSVFLGFDTRALADNQSNQIVIGHTAVGLGSNTAVLGNDSIVTTALKGNVGIGTTTPSEKLDVNGNIIVSGSVEITDSSTGIIMKSPDGTRYRLTIANGGTLTITSI